MKRSGQSGAAPLVCRDRFGAAAKALIDANQGTVHLLGALVEIDSLQVDIGRTIDVALLLEAAREVDERPAQPCRQTRAPGDDPGVLVSGEERPAVEPQRRVDEGPLLLAGYAPDPIQA